MISDSVVTEKRPIDVLDNAKGKRVVVRLKDGREVSGVLQALDMHLNMWLDDCDVKESESTKKMGKILVRGDSIVYASPE